VQLQADLLQLMVVRPMFQETTALGAALAAGLGADVWSRELVFASASYNNIDFKPSITDTEADKRWAVAVWWLCGCVGWVFVCGSVLSGSALPHVVVSAYRRMPALCPASRTQR